MRRAHNSTIVKNSAGEFVGINLGADFCAEHEWGIKTIKRDFGIDLGEEPNVGLSKRQITKVPDHIRLLDCKVNYYNSATNRTRSRNAHVLVCDSFLNFPGWEDLENPKVVADMLRRPCDGIDFTHEDVNKSFINAAWDEGGFAIVSDNKENLQKLYDAIQNKDVVIGCFGGGVFQNAGLGVYIVSKLDKDVIKDWNKSDQDAVDLENTSKEIGIKDQLDYFNQQHYDKGGMSYDAPFGYHALTPAWVSKKRKGKTNHKVMYWLNPMGQDRNNYGWFTVEELEQWIEGKGPIPK